MANPNPMRARCPVCGVRMPPRIVDDAADYEHERCATGHYSYQFMRRTFTETVGTRSFSWKFGSDESQKIEAEVAEAIEALRGKLGIQPRRTG